MVELYTRKGVDSSGKWIEYAWVKDRVVIKFESKSGLGNNLGWVELNPDYYLESYFDHCDRLIHINFDSYEEMKFIGFIVIGVYS